ncbi:MAG: GAF domain-containing sensor histidine kinase [Chloroflexi bacterium]|nr:GAF domain-containing sensor histidine kinase [Chloroflexota bacterium]
MTDPKEIQSDTTRLRKLNRELSILTTIAEALNRQIDLPQALNTVLVQVGDLLDLHTGWVWLMSETGQSYLATSKDLPPGLASNPKLMEGSCYCLRTYQNGDMEGAANVNVIGCSRLNALVDGTGGLGYHASIPLYASDDTKLGVLNLASPDWRELTPDELQLLHAVGDLLSIAIERARLFEQRKQMGALEERNRLAREIHDTLAQGLTAIALQLESAEALMDAGDDLQGVRQRIGQALELARDNLNEARRSVLDLRATPLQGRTLVEAVEELARKTAAEAGLEVNVKVTGTGGLLSPRIEVGLYRIAQEALNNVVRHAEARRVAVEIETTTDLISLTIEDDGRGFDIEDIADGRYGLVGLNERIKLLGGELALESAAGVGTRIIAHVPLTPSDS